MERNGTCWITKECHMTVKLTEDIVGVFSDPHLGVHQGSETWHKIALDFAADAAETYKK